MSKTLNRLPPRAAETISKPGRHADGGNLYLVVSPDGRTKKWTFMYVLKGRQREAGLGPAGADGVSLKTARTLAEKMRAQLRDGDDPLGGDSTVSRDIPTFAESAADYIDTHQDSWVNAKHLQQWQNTIDTYCGPIASTPVDKIDTEAVLKVLKPIWTRVPETASRLRGRIEMILNAARAHGFIDADKSNPARWRGHLDHLLPKRNGLSRGHHAAMPYADVPAFIVALQTLDTVGARALEFTILTAVRSGETRGALWDEFDLDKRIWTIPPKRTKTQIEHRVPLAARALAIIEQQHSIHPTGGLMFPGTAGGPLSDMTLLLILRRAKIDATPHGFRSTFRDYVGDQTQFPRELAEHALGHAVGGQVERSYRRLDALEKRRVLMEAWGDYCMSAVKTVEPVG